MYIHFGSGDSIVSTSQVCVPTALCYWMWKIMKYKFGMPYNDLNIQIRFNKYSITWFPTWNVEGQTDRQTLPLQVS